MDTKKKGKNIVLTFKLGAGDIIQIKTNPEAQEMTVQKLGKNKENGITDEDRKFLQDLTIALKDDPEAGTTTVDTIRNPVQFTLVRIVYQVSCSDLY